MPESDAEGASSRSEHMLKYHPHFRELQSDRIIVLKLNLWLIEKRSEPRGRPDGMLITKRQYENGLGEESDR